MLRRSFQFLAFFSILSMGLYSLYAQWQMTRNEWNPERELNNPVVQWEKRISHLPESFDTGEEVGYLADWDIDPLFMPIDQDQEYVLTQYALAPSVLRRGKPYLWIVGNFTLATREVWFDKNLQGASINKVGFGIYLISRVEK